MKRLAFLDAIKGMAILLVVAGHLMIRMGISGYENIVWTFINSVHLPLFFFVSGFLGEKTEIRFKAILTKAKVLLFPALIFFTLYTISHDSSPFSFLKYGFQEYWFTFVLFEIFLIFYICSLILRKYKYIALIAFSLLGVAFLSISSTRGGQLGTILCLENLAKYFQFFTLGVLSKKYENKILPLLRSDGVKGVLLACYVLSFFLCFSDHLEQTSIIYKFNHDLILRCVGVFLVVAFFTSQSDFFDRKNVVSQSLLFVGKRTLDIYLIHYFLLPASIYFPKYLIGNDMWYIQLVILFLLSLIVVAGCLAISKIIRFCPSLSSLVLGTPKSRLP